MPADAVAVTGYDVINHERDFLYAVTGINIYSINNLNREYNLTL